MKLTFSRFSFLTLLMIHNGQLSPVNVFWGRPDRVLESQGLTCAPCSSGLHRTWYKDTVSHSSVLQTMRRWRDGEEGCLIPGDLLLENWMHPNLGHTVHPQNEPKTCPLLLLPAETPSGLLT